MKKSMLSVQPIRRYPQPKYPSWQQPNPLQHPETVPYPIRKRAWHLLATSGLISSMAISGTQCSVKGGAGADDLIQLDSLYNPFPAQFSGIPHHISSYGTGIPDRMNEKEVRHLIEKVFVERGIQLQPDYRLDADGHTFLLSGFDPKQKIGYLFVTANRIDESGIIRFPDPKTHSFQGYVDNAEVFLSQGIDKEGLLTEEVMEKLVKIKVEPDAALRQKWMHSVLMEGFIQRQKPERFPDWLKRWIDEALQQTDPSQRQYALERSIHAIDLLQGSSKYSPSYEISQIIRHVLEEYDRMGKIPLSNNEVQALRSIFEYAEAYGYQVEYLESPEERERALNKARDFAVHVHWDLLATGTALVKNVQSLARDADAFFISPSELDALDTLGQQGKLFILAVTNFNGQLIYESMDPEYYKESLEKFRAEGDSLLVKELEELPLKFKPHRLKMLEEDVQRYLLWAKKQGKY